jgi:hypothetical protein
MLGVVPAWPKSKFFLGMPERALGTKRLALGHYVAGLVSIDAFQGNPVTIFSEPELTNNIYAVSGLQQANQWFLSLEALIVGDRIKTVLVISDGITKSVPLMSPVPEEDDGTPAFANTHVGWLRGYGYKDLNTFEKVEIWASEFVPSNPHQINAYKVQDFEGTYNSITTGYYGGGWGWFLYTLGWTDATPIDHIHLVDLTKKHPPLIIEVPDAQRMLWVAGFTRTHVWFTIGVEVPGRRLIRWRLPSGG